MPVIEVPGKGNVEFPDTMDHGQIVAAIKGMTAPEAPLSPEHQASIDKNAPAPDTFLNKMGRIVGYAQRNPALSDASRLSLVTPPGVGTVLGRIGLNAGVQGAGSLARGEGPLQAAKETAMGGVGTAIGEGAVKGVKAISGGPLKNFATRAEEGLTNLLRERVPAWKGMGSLREMLYDQSGHDALHQAYDQSMQDVVKKGVGKMVQVPVEVAKGLGLATGPTFQFPAHIAERIGGGPLGGPPPGMAPVDAADLAKAMLGKAGTPEYRAAAKALDAAGIGDPAAREAYKTAMGLKDFISRTGGMPTGEFDVIRAQKGLGGPASGELLGRGMQGDVKGILNPGGGPFIEKGNQSVAGSLAGGLLGGTVGLPLGGHLGAGGGMLSGAYLGHRLGTHVPRYTNVPEGPLQPQKDEALRALIRAVGLQSISS